MIVTNGSLANLPEPGTPRVWARVRRMLTKSPSIAVAGGILGLIALAALLAPVLGLPDPNAQDLAGRLQPPLTPGHLLGTDELGRDIVTRLIYGSRVSLTVALAAVLIGGVIGTVLGLVAGHYRGIVDDVISWLINVQLAFPFILLMVAVVAILGPSLTNLIVVLGIGSWAIYARIVRSEVLSVSRRDFVKSAKTIGVSELRLLFRHILPNVFSPLIVILSFEIASMIITESALSFLGLGVGPDTPSWGSMLSTGRQYIQTAWWLTALPGLAIVVAVLCINLIGDWLRDVLDPRRRGRS